MAPTSIDLYEALKKDMSEESARMITEGLSRAGELATRADIRADIITEVGAAESRLKAYIDSRLLRYTAMILVPVSLTMLGSVGALIALVIKL